MKNFYTDLPEGLFFAFYSDLSGAQPFKRVSEFAYKSYEFDELVDHHWFLNCGYLWFIEIDDSFEELIFKGNVLGSE